MPTAKSAKPVWKVNPIPGSKNLYINSVGISGDGQKVIGGNYYYDYDKTANHDTTSAPTFTVGTFLWNAQGKLQWKDTIQATEGIYWVALSNDGTCAASGGLQAQGNGFVFAYDAATGKKLLTYNTNARVNRVALS